MRVGVSAGRGGGSCALGVDRRRSVESTGRGEARVWPGSRGERVGGGSDWEKSYEVRRGDARGRTR